MNHQEIRNEFLDFFKKKGHVIVPSSSLVPTDPSVLFTTAGMQQFKPYYLGEKSPFGLNTASCQKCFRTSDIEEVGDTSHLTFLEMLGNFSFGLYFKEEAISLAYEFLFKVLKLSQENVFFTVFEGDKNIPLDQESISIWKKLGVPNEKIKKFGKKDNFWGPTGDEGPCGPNTEIHINNTEVWNLVFNEYYQDKNNKLTPLKVKGVDTGMGLERLAMVLQKKSSVFETGLFNPITGELLKMAKVKPEERIERIISDHVKSSVFLIADGILPSNVERGYVLRRVLRRAIRFGKLLKLDSNFLIPLAQKAIEIYQGVYPEVKSKEAEILTVIQNEEEKFEKLLEKGIKEFNKLSQKGSLTGEESFNLFATYGFPIEITKELAEEHSVNIDVKGFEQAFKKHQEISRAGAEKKFGGVGKDAGYESAKLHTATHLLHAALRKVLGKEVKQMGSDINALRLRFDFSYNQKLTPDQIKDVERIVNEIINEDLEAIKEEMSFEHALKSGALAFFKDKYPEQVTVYSIKGFSKEICAGPHVKRTKELGSFKIIKEESSSAGVRRIRGVLN